MAGWMDVNLVLPGLARLVGDYFLVLSTRLPVWCGVGM